jgi:ABC-type Zn uptake system ZnuABC Zn-binding protein ZnuA
MSLGRTLWAVSAAALAAALLASCGVATAQPASKVKVAASIVPLGDFVRQVGGDRVEVMVMVPPGAAVETYEPAPMQMRFLETAQVLVLNGVSLEFWASSAISSVARADLLVVDTSKGIKLLDVGTDPESSSGNPHIWMDPQRAMVQVEHIRDALIQVDPAGTATYTANAERYINQLRALDQEIEARVATWSTKEFISFHAAYRYFADRYGLDQVAVIEEFPGKEPTPGYVASVIDEARKMSARAIFADVQFSPMAVQTIAGETGKKVVFLDDLGGMGARKTYIDTIQYDVAEMESALK